MNDHIPESLVRALDDEVLDDPDQSAFLLVTTDDDGAPRISMVSVGELLVCGTRTLRLALWPGTNTARNLGRGGAVLLGFVSPDSVTYVCAEPVRLAVPEPAALECFELTVTEVRVDVHVGMPVTSGITFRVEGPDRTTAVATWRRQRALLAEVSRDSRA